MSFGRLARTNLVNKNPKAHIKISNCFSKWTLRKHGGFSNYSPLGSYSKLWRIWNNISFTCGVMIWLEKNKFLLKQIRSYDLGTNQHSYYFLKPASFFQISCFAHWKLAQGCNCQKRRLLIVVLGNTFFIQNMQSHNPISNTVNHFRLCKHLCFQMHLTDDSLSFMHFTSFFFSGGDLGKVKVRGC